MTVSHVEVLVEEPSMEAALAALLPKMLTRATSTIHVHNGRRELLAKLPRRLRGYAEWVTSEHRVVVVVDRDAYDCVRLKRDLEQVARDAGLATRRTATTASAVRVIPRIACEELEAWFFGDWRAVRAAYPRVPEAVPTMARYRDPDAITGGTWEALERVLQRAGYFAGGLRKVEAARTIAPRMDPRRNTSQSFRALRDALLDLGR